MATTKVKVSGSWLTKIVHFQKSSILKYLCFLSSPITPSCVSTALAQTCLIFLSALCSQETRYFFVKMGLSRHPSTATKALLRSSHGVLSLPMEFLQAILCALTTISLHFLSTNNACTALTQHSHCADSILKVQ